MNRLALLGDLFAPVLPLLSMLDEVPVVTLTEAVVRNSEGKSLSDAEVKQYRLPDMPARHSLRTLCEGVLESALFNPLLPQMPPTIHGIDSHHFVAALIMYTMETPYPFYRLITCPLNVHGVRNKDSLQCQLRFMKLLTLALRYVPRTGEFWYTGPVYRGVSIENRQLRAKYENFETAFAPRTRITFAAPTSTTLRSQRASEFTDGIQYVIQGERGEGGPGGVYLMPGVLSVFDEEEVLLEAPLVCEVVAATKPDRTVIVVLRAINSRMTYLSASADDPVGHRIWPSLQNPAPASAQPFLPFRLIKGRRVRR